MKRCWHSGNSNRAPFGIHTQLKLLLIDTLIQQQHHQSAFELLAPLLRKQADDALWQRCARLQLKDYSVLLKALLQQLKQHPQSPALLSALGHFIISSNSVCFSAGAIWSAVFHYSQQPQTNAR